LAPGEREIKFKGEINMTTKIDTTIEVQEVKTSNFGPLFDREDISEANLIGGEQPEKEKEAVPGGRILSGRCATKPCHAQNRGLVKKVMAELSIHIIAKIRNTTGLLAI
jgi:hypothetical protein